VESGVLYYSQMDVQTWPVLSNFEIDTVDLQDTEVTSISRLHRSGLE